MALGPIYKLAYVRENTVFQSVRELCIYNKYTINAFVIAVSNLLTY